MRTRWTFFVVKNHIFCYNVYIAWGANMIKNKKKSLKLQTKHKWIIAIVAIYVIATIIAFVTIKPFNFLKYVKSETVVSRDELRDKLDVDIKEPSDGKNVVYGIENDSIAKVSYKKVVSDGMQMDFVMRTSYSVEDIEKSIDTKIEFAYTPIMMTVVCKDGSEVPVESKVALDEKEAMRYMKALWYDNDKYYSMFTDNLVTREDFLQEVNRVIIANHEEF